LVLRSEVLTLRDWFLAAIDTVMGWLSHSHSEQAKTVREEEVSEVLRSDYYSIAPWPFAALTT